MRDKTPADTETSRPVSSVVTERLRAAVLAGEFAPGERLYEVDLSERLGVSRTPVRTALQALASDGLLVHVPHRGYCVRAFDLSETMQAYEIRAVLEGLAARRAAQRGLSAEECRAVERALNEGDQLLSRGYLIPEDRIAYSAINFTIHNAIYDAGHSRMLGEMLRLSQQVAPSSYRNVIAFEYNDVRRRHDDHRRIFEAILCRDGARAEMLMRDHVESVRLALIRASTEPTDAPASSERSETPGLTLP